MHESQRNYVESKKSDKKDCMFKKIPLKILENTA